MNETFVYLGILEQDTLGCTSNWISFKNCEYFYLQVYFLYR